LEVAGVDVMGVDVPDEDEIVAAGDATPSVVGVAIDGPAAGDSSGAAAASRVRVPAWTKRTPAAIVNRIPSASAAAGHRVRDVA
jgi:hypothetical protein